MAKKNMMGGDTISVSKSKIEKTIEPSLGKKKSSVPKEGDINEDGSVVIRHKQTGELGSVRNGVFYKIDMGDLRTGRKASFDVPGRFSNILDKNDPKVIEYMKKRKPMGEK